MRHSGLDLLAARIASLDPDAPTARERLEDALGPTLTAFLIAVLLVRAG
jgi:hypothetical protein